MSCLVGKGKSAIAEQPQEPVDYVSFRIEFLRSYFARILFRKPWNIGPAPCKTIFLRVQIRAIAGLWPWGLDRIALPSSDGVMFIPRQPYVPLGTLFILLLGHCIH